MTVRDLFANATSGCRVVLKDMLDRVVYAGKFDDFPYKYADCYVHGINAVGNALVIWMYD